MFAAYKARKLTLLGSLTGGGVAVGIYVGAYFTGIAMLATFFVLAVLATSWGKRMKRKITNGEAHSEIRDARQVLANGAVAALCGLMCVALPQSANLLAILMAASLASATADTLSSELGTLYGNRFYNILTFKPDEKGRDGVVSLEGTLTGIAGATAIAVVYSIGIGWHFNNLFCIVLAGAIGNLADSFLGATLERHGYLKNNAVNFWNTALAALFALAYLSL